MMHNTIPQRVRTFALALVGAAFLLLAPATVRAEGDPVLDVGGGFSRLTLDKGPSMDGVAFLARLRWPLVDENFGPTIGFGIGGESYWKDLARYPSQHLSNLSVMNLDGNFSLRWDIGGSGVFIEPALAAGPLLASWAVEEQRPGWTETKSDVAFGAHVRPSLAIGYQKERVGVGAELWYDLQFLKINEDIGGTNRGWGLGVFLRILLD